MYNIYSICTSRYIKCTSRTFSAQSLYVPAQGTPTLATKGRQVRICIAEIRPIIPRKFLKRLDCAFREEGKAIETPVNSSNQDRDINKICVLTPTHIPGRIQICVRVEHINKISCLWLELTCGLEIVQCFQTGLYQGTELSRHQEHTHFPNPHQFANYKSDQTSSPYS